MQSQLKERKRPLTAEELAFQKTTNPRYELNGVIENIPLEKVPLEERRREANKPLYLLRYE